MISIIYSRHGIFINFIDLLEPVMSRGHLCFSLTCIPIDHTDIFVSGAQFRKGLWAHVSNLSKNTCCFHLQIENQFRSQWCTCHNSSAVVTCANLWPDWLIRIIIPAKKILKITVMSSWTLREKGAPAVLFVDHWLRFLLCGWKWCASNIILRLASNMLICKQFKLPLYKTHA